ncbi:hypothetical protein [Trueperella bialowiezensis]|uniref:hypothetical protein n=1 Tax=Trueperella bialowiezensis TaxID=312285 RepID=UPI000F81FA46|nr:hypothetical protein [Trueperella bialowiezensis]
MKNLKTDSKKNTKTNWQKTSSNQPNTPDATTKNDHNTKDTQPATRQKQPDQPNTHQPQRSADTQPAKPKTT